MSETQTCPRRMREFGPWERGADLDRWDEERGYRNCSFCGSLHPDDFLAAVEAGAEVGPTDKGYKAYIDLPEKEPDSLRIVSHVRGDREPSFGEGWQRRRDVDLSKVDTRGWLRADEEWPDDEWLLIQARGATRHAKFYFQHLSPEQVDRFIELHNSQVMKIGYPGHFYTRPFFAQPRKDSE